MSIDVIREDLLAMASLYNNMYSQHQTTVTQPKSSLISNTERIAVQNMMKANAQTKSNNNDNTTINMKDDLVSPSKILQAAAVSLLANELYDCAALLKLVVRIACLPIDSGAEDFACVKNTLAPAQSDLFFHLMKILSVFAGNDLDRYWANQYMTTDNSPPPTSTSASYSSGGGGGGEEKRGQESAEEQAERARIQPVPETSLIQWGGPDLQGAQRERKEITRRFIYPLVFSRALTGEKGLMLYGPPGTGKTQIAKGLASLFRSLFPLSPNDIQLYAAAGSDLLGKFVGDAQVKINRWYAVLQARAEAYQKEHAVSLLFIDEIEALAGDRLNDNTGVMQASVTAFLQALDGIRDYSKVITIAATNIPWTIDSAVDRRFTTKIFVDLPGWFTRFGIISSLIKGRIHPPSARFIALRAQSKPLTASERDFIAKEQNARTQSRLKVDNNRDMQILFCQLTYATGWTDQAIKALNQNLLVQRIKSGMQTVEGDKTDKDGKKTVKLNNDDEQLLGKFILEGVHSTRHYFYPSETRGFTDEDRVVFDNIKTALTKENNTPSEVDSAVKPWTTILNADGKGAEIMAPKNIFGLSAADLANVMKKGLNEFAIHLMMRTTDASGKFYICPPKHPSCVSSNDRDFTISFATLSDKINILRQHLVSSLHETPSTVRTEEYKNLVYYALTGNKPEPM